MIAIACDHAAFELKNKIAAFLKERGLVVMDFGCYACESADYPDYALPAALAVSRGECEKGIVICGSGIGISIAANKIRGIRCALCGDLSAAKACREHNDANMLAMGARFTDTETALKVVACFLETPFSGEPRHQKRIDKIKEIEERFFK